MIFIVFNVVEAHCNEFNLNKIFFPENLVSFLCFVFCIAFYILPFWRSTTLFDPLIAYNFVSLFICLWIYGFVCLLMILFHRFRICLCFIIFTYNFASSFLHTFLCRCFRIQFFHYFRLRFCSSFLPKILFHRFGLRDFISSLPVASLGTDLSFDVNEDRSQPRVGSPSLPPSLSPIRSRWIQGFIAYALEWLATNVGCSSCGLVCHNHFVPYFL